MAPSPSPSSSSPENFHHQIFHQLTSFAAGFLPHNHSTHSSLPPLPSAVVAAPIILPFSTSLPSQHQSTGPTMRSLSSSGVRIDGLGAAAKGKGGPAFVGQVFSMLDPSGNGLMAVTTRWDIPFISKRTPEWFRKMLSAVTKSDQNGPVFRFFMDLTDAVAYVKRLNIPTGMVGACRLDVAYEHFKEKPCMFQFVPNEKQVRAANKLLRGMPQKRGRRKLDGVPVFTAQNLNIAIATNDGIKWYTPYFFDKNLLDNILEASIDQHFHTLIQNRHVQRRREVIDDGLTAEIVEENMDSLFEPPEVQEVLDEMGHTGIPLSIISKAAEIQMLDVVDKVFLGNKWLRKATGIQPKFPYVVDSFEKRTAACVPQTCASLSSDHISNAVDGKREPTCSSKDAEVSGSQDHFDFRFPFGNWFSNPWSRIVDRQQKFDKTGVDFETRSSGDVIDRAPPNPLLPKITMVGISMGEGGQVSKATLKKTMEGLTKELESNQKLSKLNEEKDPLFVANVGDYSNLMRMNTA